MRSKLNWRLDLKPLGLLLSALILVIPPSAAAQVQVNSADPPEAEQGTVSLDVTINGRGFDRGSEAKWFVTGTTNPGGVTVNSTRFVNANTLVANITVDDAAQVGKFDIVVQTSKGRTGKGTEIFSVVEKGSSSAAGDSIAASGEIMNGAGMMIRPDAQGIYIDSALSGTGCTRCITGCAGDTCEGFFLRPYGGTGGACPGPNSLSNKECEDVESYKARLQALGILRQVELDFSFWVGAIPNCDELPGGDCGPSQQFIRLWADDAFKPGASFTPVRLAVDQPRRSDAKTCHMFEFWELVFERTLQITEIDANTRVVSTIEADSNADIVHVYKVIWKAGHRKELTSVGRFHMPMSIRISKSGISVFDSP